MPPKAIFVLLSIKSSLINKSVTLYTQTPSTSTDISEPQSVTITLLDTPKMRKEHKSTVRMRHAKGGGAFQRSCRRKDWSSPVY